MKKVRLHIGIVLAFFVIALIFGSFFDLQINEAIFASRDTGAGVFGIVVAAFSMIFGYAILPLFGGAFFHAGLKQNHPLWLKVIFFVLSVAYLGVGAYYAGKEIFGTNGFDVSNIRWVGYLIALPLMCLIEALGYFAAEKINHEKLWILLLVISAFLALAMLGGMEGLKSVFHRPRYRIAVRENYIGFFSWWKPCKDYKSLIESVPALTKEEFKSFPSGHTGVSANLMIIASLLPLLGKKAEKLQIPMFYCGFAFTLFVAFTRLLVGAHYLSDISMGGIVTMVCFLIANEIFINVKGLQEIAAPKE